MAICRILKVGNPLLRRKSLPVPLNEITSKEIKKLIRDLTDTMKEADGIGIAAPQIGVLKQVVVVGYDKGKNKRYPTLLEGVEDHVLINPVIEILEVDENDKNSNKNTYDTHWEGCLSVPDLRSFIKRANKIRIKYYDEKENFHDVIIDDFRAKVYQHECDHLNGNLIIDKIEDTRKGFGFTDEVRQFLIP